MLVLHQFLYVLYALYDIYWTNLLTSATVPVSVYYVCLLQKRSKIESARKNLENSQKFLFTRRLRKPEDEVQEGHRAPRHGPGAAALFGAPRGCLGDSDSPSRRLFVYKSPSDLKLRGENHPSTKSSVAPPPAETRVRGTEVSVPAPCRDRELPPEPSPSTPPPPLRLHDGL